MKVTDSVEKSQYSCSLVTKAKGTILTSNNTMYYLTQFHCHKSPINCDYQSPSHNNAISQQAKKQDACRKGSTRAIRVYRQAFTFLTRDLHVVCLAIITQSSQKIIILRHNLNLNAKQYTDMLNLYEQGITMGKCDPI